MFYKIMRILVWPFIKLFYPTKVIGRENLPEGKAVLVCNHYRMADVLVLGVNIKKPLNFMGKKELFENKFTRWLLTKLNGFPVDREKPDLHAVRQGLKILKDDRYLAIFPEGTRNKTGGEQLQQIKSGAVFFAVKGDAPVVPMMLMGPPRFLKINRLVIGKPLSLSGYADRKLDENASSEAAGIIFREMEGLRSRCIESEKEKKKIKNSSETDELQD